MQESWTSRDLALLLGVQPGPALGRRLQTAIRELARSGRLAGGAGLPSSREIASELGVSRGTVVAVYEQLIAEGYLVARPGGGTRVAPAAHRPDDDRRAPAPTLPATYDLRPGVPDLSRFPASDWAWALADAARRIRPHDLDYGDGRGHPDALEAIAGYVRRARSAVTRADDLVLGAGFAQCIAMTFDVLAARGVAVVAVEDPGDRSVDGAAARAGIAAVAIPVDADGLDVSRLDASDAGAVLVTPAHQSPTGAVLSPARRAALVDWAARRDAWIIEDDYDSEFRYDRQPVGSLQGLSPDRVILIGTVSKTHAPALRIAWLVAPSVLVSALAERKRSVDRGSSAIDQLAFAALLASGRHDRHVRAMRGVYARRRRVLVDALAAELPGAALVGLDAGFHGVLALPEGTSEADIVASAAARLLRLTGLAGSTRVRDDLPPAIVLGFGDIDDVALVEAISILGEIVRQLPRHPA